MWVTVSSLLQPPTRYSLHTSFCYCGEKWNLFLKQQVLSQAGRETPLLSSWLSLSQGGRTGEMFACHQSDVRREGREGGDTHVLHFTINLMRAGFQISNYTKTDTTATITISLSLLSQPRSFVYPG